MPLIIFGARHFLVARWPPRVISLAPVCCGCAFLNGSSENCENCFCLIAHRRIVHSNCMPARGPSVCFGVHQQNASLSLSLSLLLYSHCLALILSHPHTFLTAKKACARARFIFTAYVCTKYTLHIHRQHGQPQQQEEGTQTSI